MKKKKTKDVRLNLRFHEDLAEWAKKYAKKRRTSVTQIVTDHFVDLREKERA